jgi:hypothetical protein
MSTYFGANPKSVITSIVLSVWHISLGVPLAWRAADQDDDLYCAPTVAILARHSDFIRRIPLNSPLLWTVSSSSHLRSWHAPCVLLLIPTFALGDTGIHSLCHIDKASKSEQIEMLRGLVIRHGRDMDPELFGFEARSELVRLGLWGRIGPAEG